ncbi:MAG: ATP-binding cassette domain-containing protein [Spirochaetes bacterium]|nr:ATP-binding cassette domain-containing protein [Spirochaetota bacterium]
MEIISKNLSFSYSNLFVLNNISFVVNKGEVVSFIGPSGCGKTTLLKIIGKIKNNFEGSLQNKFSNISIVFQHDTLLNFRTVYKNLYLPFEMKNIKIDSEINHKIENILKMVGLLEFKDYFPDELSGGMKKRAEIARALVNDPDLLILDEPFSSLDILTREKLNIMLKNIIKKLNITTIIVTHSVEEACFLSDKIFIMSSLPSKIINTLSLKKENTTYYDSFILSEEEKNAENFIRKNVKELWDINEENQKELKKQANNKNLKNTKFYYKFPFFIKSFIKIKSKLLSFLNLIIFLITLFLIKNIFNISDLIFPSPEKIILKFFKTIKDGSIFKDLGITIYESLSGFFIAFFITLFLGIFLSKNKKIYSIIMPYLISFNTIPSVAIAPFIVLWFGFGLTSKIFVSIIVIFFPMLINNISAIKIAYLELEDLIQFYKPNKLKSFLKLEFPKSLPIIFSGIKVSITLSVIGAVVGEFVAGSDGLGSLIRIAKANFDIELMFVGLIWLIILGLSYFKLANFFYNIFNKNKKIKDISNFNS